MEEPLHLAMKRGLEPEREDPDERRALEVAEDPASFHFPAELWIRCLYDALVAFHRPGADREKLLAALTLEDRVPYALAFYAGRRREEISRLLWEDVQLDGYRLHVRKSKSAAGTNRRPPIAAPLLITITRLPGANGRRRASRSQWNVIWTSVCQLTEKVSHVCSCSGRRCGLAPATRTTASGWWRSSRPPARP